MLKLRTVIHGGLCETGGEAFDVMMWKRVCGGVPRGCSKCRGFHMTSPHLHGIGPRDPHRLCGRRRPRQRSMSLTDSGKSTGGDSAASTTKSVRLAGGVPEEHVRRWPEHPATTHATIGPLSLPFSMCISRE